jgi:hypothetical protein
MPKRTFWLVTGAAVGAGSSLWAERRVRRTVQQATARLQPDALVVEVGRTARQVAGGAGDRFRDAVTTGRQAMLRREEELWSDLAAQGVATDLAPRIGAGARDGARAGATVPSGPTGPTGPPAAALATPSAAHQEPGRSRPPRRRRKRLAAQSPSELAR